MSAVVDSRGIGHGAFLLPTAPEAQQHEPEAMLKSKYPTLDAIPEGDRQHYKLVNGEYVLELDDQHPVAAKNAELLREKQSLQGQVTRLTNEKATLEATALPAGHVAVPAADAQLVAEYKALGKAADIKAALAERDTLKTEAVGLKRKETLRAVAEAEGYDADVLAEMPRIAELEFEVKEAEKDGKKIKAASVSYKDGEKTVSKPVAEYAGENWGKFMASLKPAGQQQQGVKFPRQGGDQKPPPKNVFDKIREESKQRQEAEKTGVDERRARLGLPTGAVKPA